MGLIEGYKNQVDNTLTQNKKLLQLLIFTFHNKNCISKIKTMFVPICVFPQQVPCPQNVFWLHTLSKFLNHQLHFFMEDRNSLSFDPAVNFVGKEYCLNIQHQQKDRKEQITLHNFSQRKENEIETEKTLRSENSEEIKIKQNKNPILKCLKRKLIRKSSIGEKTKACLKKKELCVFSNVETIFEHEIPKREPLSNEEKLAKIQNLLCRKVVGEWVKKGEGRRALKDGNFQ